MKSYTNIFLILFASWYTGAIALAQNCHVAPKPGEVGNSYCVEFQEGVPEPVQKSLCSNPGEDGQSENIVMTHPANCPSSPHGFCEITAKHFTGKVLTFHYDKESARLQKTICTNSKNGMGKGVWKLKRD